MLRAVAAAAGAARQWLKAAATKWRFDPMKNAGSKSSSAAEQQKINVSQFSSAEEEQGINALEMHQLDTFLPIDDPVLTTSPQSSEEMRQKALNLLTEEPQADQLDEDTISSAASSIILRIKKQRLPIVLPRKLLWDHRRGVRSRIIGEVLQTLTDAQSALGFFRWVADESGCKHDTYTLNSLLLTLIRSGNAAAAYDVFKSQALDPDSLTVSTILYGLCDSGQLQKACDFCSEVKSSGVVIYDRVLSTLVQALCSSGSVDRALTLTRELAVDPDDCVYSYSIVIHSLCKLKKPGIAWSLFYEVQERGGSVNAHVYASLMHGLCKSGEVRQAWNLLEEMTRKGCRIDAVIYNTLIDGFCKARKVNQALQLLEIMNADGFDACVVTYTTLIDGLCKSREIDKARLLIQQMVDRGCSPNVVTYSAIIDGLCKAKRMEEAIDVVKQMMSNGVEPDLVTYNSLIHGFCISQKLLEASWVLDELLEKGFVPNCITYNTLIIGHCRGKRIERALALLREMILRGSVCNLVVYIDLIYGFCEASCGSHAGDCCRAEEEVGNLYKLLEELVKQSVAGDGILRIVFEGDSFYDPVVRLDRVEQILEFMHQRGCVGDENRFNALQEALTTIRRLKSPVNSGQPKSTTSF